MKKIFLMLVSLLCLSSCTINNEDIEAAQKACEPNGGLKYVYSDIGETQFYCQNGASFNKLTFKQLRENETTRNH
jgi:hypothetical protein